MSSATKYDILVIGTGPGGEGAAMQAAKMGKKACAIERFSRIGGGCTHWGTIPSKALRYSIFQLTEFANNPIGKELNLQFNVEFPQLRRSAKSIIDKQVDMRRQFYDRNDIPVITGDAQFIDAHTLEITEERGAKERFEAEHILIAVGSRPYRPESIDFSHPRVFDSDTILDLSYTPHSITIYGAGVIGCEYASMFRNLGCKVNLVNTRGKLLEFLDDEIIDALAYSMRDRGILIRHNELFEKIEASDEGVVTHLQSGKALKSDIFLWANGRNGNTVNLGLDKIGIAANERGLLKVNENFQTDVPNVYAVGDVIGFPSLASAAYSQGRAAARHIYSNEDCKVSVGEVPTGIYTSPEISSVGKTERELTAAKIPYEVGQAQFKSLARAQITGRTTGMLKLLFHREDLRLLGIHCFGSNAAEIIHIGQAILSQEGKANSLLYFINTTFNYPTMAEAYRVAALNGFNRLF